MTMTTSRPTSLALVGLLSLLGATSASAAAIDKQTETAIDPEDTLRRLDARYKQIAAFAAAPLTAPPPPVSPGTLPWTELVSNPIGKQTLMMLEADVSTVFQNFERKRLEMAKRREGVVTSLRACLEK